MYRFKAVVMIVCQTAAAFGLGVNIMCLHLLRLPGGPDMVAKIFNFSVPSEGKIVIMTIICFIATVTLTFMNFGIILEAVRIEEHYFNYYPKKPKEPKKKGWGGIKIK